MHPGPVFLFTMPTVAAPRVCHMSPSGLRHTALNITKSPQLGTWRKALDDSAAMTCSTSFYFFPRNLRSPALWPSAAYSSCLRSLNVSSRNPRLIIALRASRDSRSISANHRRLISRVDRLAAT